MAVLTLAAFEGRSVREGLLGPYTQRARLHLALDGGPCPIEGQGAVIEQWLRVKDTVLFLGVWEQPNNPGFSSLEFKGIRNEAGRNGFFLSVKKWAEKTGAIGVHASAGHYGGTTPNATLPSSSTLTTKKGGRR